MKKNRTETKRLSTLKLLFRRERRIVFSAFNQFLAVFLLGAIAVTLFVGLLANADAFENQIAEAYREGNIASLYVTVDNYEEEEEEKLSSLEGHVKMAFDKDGCALAKKLAESLNVKEGDTIKITLDGKKSRLRISLIYYAFFFNRLLLSSENSLFPKQRTPL